MGLVVGVAVAIVAAVGYTLRGIGRAVGRCEQGPTPPEQQQQRGT
jgi:hypothetical protein